MFTLLLADGSNDLRRIYAASTPTDTRALLARVASHRGYEGVSVHRYAADPCYLGM